jgi:hypothetical protein
VLVISHERRRQYSAKTDGALPNYAALPRKGPLCSGAAQNGRFVSQICNRGATFPPSCIGCAECDSAPDFSFSARRWGAWLAASVLKSHRLI